MARTPNYDFEKRKKEAERKARKDAKRDEKLRRRENGEEPVDDAAPSAQDLADLGILPPPA